MLFLLAFCLFTYSSSRVHDINWECHFKLFTLTLAGAQVSSAAILHYL